MLVSYNWLKQYVDLPDSLTPEELALKLTMSTVEVEGVKKLGEGLENIVVAEIKELKKHPNADKLQLCQVFDGQETVQVVCGGSNLKKGMKVALGKVGAKVKWHGEGDLIELKKAKIRGEESNGMICQSTEIGLGDFFPLKSEAEIIDLSKMKAKAGDALAKVLGLNDAIFDIDNKSMTHRPDLWGHYGLAREVVAAYNKKLKEYKPPEIKKQDTRNKQILNLKLQIDVQDTELCPRYMAVAIGGIKVEPSPEWLQKRLIAVGLRPINNIVDITNYVMYDLGQPMHAFDESRIKTKDSRLNIIVRRAKDGENFKTLDGKEHVLTSENLMIADEEKALALAGVMGGENSEISDNTKTIIYESANFDATNIRRTALKLGLRTDSSARFEKSLDPHNAELALKRAVALTLELCPEAKVVSNVADEAHFTLPIGPIELSLGFLRKKMGVDIEKKQAVKILQSLGFGIEIKKDILKVTIPTWRATKDISIAEDLVEEIARVYGYGNIATSLPVFPVAPPLPNKLRELERKIKNILSLEYGYTETLNYSFVAPELIQAIGLSLDKHIELDNPIAKDRPYVRRSLLPNLLENVEKNLHARETVCLFEIGKVFLKDESGERISQNSDELLPRQDVMCGAVYAEKGNEMPFFALASALRGMLDNCGCKYELKPIEHPAESYVHPGRSAAIIIENTSIGIIAELHPAVQKRLDIDARCAFAEINLSVLLGFIKEQSRYASVPQYPAVLRDIAFVVDKNIMHSDIVQAIYQTDKLIVQAELFDVFEGANLGKDKKSMAYHIAYRSDEKTLEAGEVDRVHGEILKVLKKKFNAEIRN